MDELTTIGIPYGDYTLDVSTERGIRAVLEDLWLQHHEPEQTQHVNVGYAVWAFIRSRSDTAQQLLTKKYEADCQLLTATTPPAPTGEAVPVPVADGSDDTHAQTAADSLALAQNLRMGFVNAQFQTKETLQQLQEHYELCMFLPAVAVVTACLQEYQMWRANLKPHTLDYVSDILENRVYRKESLFWLFYDYCEGNILTNVFWVMRQYRTQEVIFNVFNDGIIEHRQHDRLFRECFDRCYGRFRKNHHDPESDWDFTPTNAPDTPPGDERHSGNGLARFTLLSESQWIKLYNRMAPASNTHDAAGAFYFFARTADTLQCWMCAYHGEPLPADVERIPWTSSAYALHQLVALMSVNETPRKDCWPIVATYFRKSDNLDKWSASTLQKATMHKGKDHDEPYVKRLHDIIKTL